MPPLLIKIKVYNLSEAIQHINNIPKITAQIYLLSYLLDCVFLIVTKYDELNECDCIAIVKSCCSSPS
jgi:hypothetical protein